MTTPIPFPADRPDVDDGRPFHELRDTGLLWLINRVVFHPRGYALALHFEDTPDRDLAQGGDVTGWSLMGDGTEPWSMGDPPPELIAKGHKTEDQLFALVQDLLAPRPAAPPVAEAPPGAPDMFLEGG